MTVNKTIAHNRLISSVDREKFKDLLRKRLIECGWRDQVRMLCRDIIKETDRKNLNVEELVSKVIPQARALVPDAIKKELYEKIKEHLITQTETQQKIKEE